MKRYILTVDWCRQGKRGPFVSRDGECYWKPEEEGPHTSNEMFDILDIFGWILNPQSLLLSDEELAEYHTFIPLGEFSDQYGIALPGTPEDQSND